jgi:hypothetical protein
MMRTWTREEAANKENQRKESVIQKVNLIDFEE